MDEQKKKWIETAIVWVGYSIVPLNCACAAYDGSGSLDVSGPPVTFSLLTNSSAATQECIDVISLATLFEPYTIDRCDFLKLDCEGAEFEIILQADPSVLNRVRTIVMEYHDHLSTNYSHLNLLEKLKSLGFQASSYNSNGTSGMIAASRPNSNSCTNRVDAVPCIHVLPEPAVCCSVDSCILVGL